jgi:hypothetical protein
MDSARCERSIWAEKGFTVMRKGQRLFRSGYTGTQKLFLTLIRKRPDGWRKRIAKQGDYVEK